MTTTNVPGFRVALIQMTVTADKLANVTSAMKRIQAAKLNGCLLAILPECFNTPYDKALFKQYSESVPGGPTCKALSRAAKTNGIYIVGGSIPEMCDDKVYNTCTVWDPNGNMIAKHRKVHLFDVQIPGKICFTESDAITPGNALTTFQLGAFKIGLGICYDIRFSEMAALYRKLNCDMLLYPSNTCSAIGHLLWSLLARARAVDNQAFVAVISPARVLDSSGYESWGHSMVVDPWGRVLDEATEEDTDLYVDLALFRQYSEVIPGGETCNALSQAAKSNEMYIVGGSIPEVHDNKVYNTCTVWDPNGNMIAKHRKMHLFDINVPGGVCFKESDALAAGNTLNTFQLDTFKIGLGICYDIRFSEMAALYRKQGCDMLIYPSAFNMTTGPLHWSLLTRCRAVDNQAFVAVASPARVSDSNYVAWGHSMIVDPWGKVLSEATEEDMDLYIDLDFSARKNMRQQIPTEYQRRTDIYDTIEIKNKY